VLEEGDDARWDRYVTGHPEGLVYHHSGWLRALQREYGRPPIRLALEDDRGELRGLLPLMATRGLPFGRARGLAGQRLASLPRTPVAGPVADDVAGLAALVSAAVARTPPGCQLQLKVAERRLDGLVEGVVEHPWRLTYTLELPSAGADVRHGNSRNHSRISWSVKRARREGLEVRDARDLRDLRAWYRLYLDTMRLHVVPARPLRLFVALWKELRPRGMMRLALVERGGVLLAGAVLLMLGPTVFYAFNGVRRSALAHRPNDLLQWEAIRRAADEGYERYDLGEVVERQQGLADFKRKWGAAPRRLHRYYWPPPLRPPDPGAPAPGPLTELAFSAWRHLPLSATATVGDHLYRLL
jgi:CelD/BcsL family acetyltransferase involved in cellulose biosynthesis